ncbi:MAG: hypothetical protein ACOYEA_07090 [Fermentimonas sp.]|jgi:hypothetical protein
MILYEDNHNISRSVYVEIENGVLSIIEQDIKPKQFEQERTFKTKELDKVLSILNAESINELLQEIKENYNTHDAFDRLTHLLHDKVKYTFNSFIS